MGSEKFYPLSSSAEEAYQKASYVVVEHRVDLFEKTSIGWCPDNITLRNYVSGKIFNKIRKRCSVLDMNFEDVCKMKPWLAALQIANAYWSSLGLSPEYGYDLYFLKRAKSDRRKIEPLETVEEALQVFDRWPKKDQVDFLKSNLKKQEDIKGYLNKKNV